MDASPRRYPRHLEPRCERDPVTNSTMIAVIDDDGSVRPALMSLVRSLGHNALGFESAEEFLASPAVGSAACIITDFQLPGISGLELARQLTTVGSAVPVIMITARADAGIERHALASGAACFLRKPFDADALIGCLTTVLAGR